MWFTLRIVVRCAHRAECRSRLAILKGVAMTPLTELIALITAPFFLGMMVGYSMRSYVSMARRSKHHPH